jgi:hypothetical protein
MQAQIDDQPGQGLALIHCLAPAGKRAPLRRCRANPILARVRPQMSLPRAPLNTGGARYASLSSDCRGVILAAREVVAPISQAGDRQLPRRNIMGKSTAGPGITGY